MYADYGYSIGVTTFVCRVARVGARNHGSVSIIKTLEEQYADCVPGHQKTMRDDISCTHKVRHPDLKLEGI